MVQDAADGALRRFKGRVLAAAGGYAVVARHLDDVDPVVRLVNWRTGRRVRTLPERAFRFEDDRQVSVGADGAVALATEQHRPTRDETIGDQVRLAGGLLAHRRVLRDNSLEDNDVFWVSRPDGSQARRVGGQRHGGGWDFDGTRLAWATQPCAQILVQVWDLATAPPPPAADHCATPRLPRGTVELRGRSLRIKLVCPAVPAQGCAGDIVASLYRRHQIGQTYAQHVRLPAGAMRTVRLRIFRPPHALRPFRARLQWNTDSTYRHRWVRVRVS